MGNPFKEIADSVSGFAGDIADAWNRPAGTSVSISKYLSYPYDLGDGSTDTIDFNSEFIGTERNAADSSGYADARNKATNEAQYPFIMFEFLRVSEPDTGKIEDEIKKIDGKILLVNDYMPDTTLSRAEQRTAKTKYNQKEKLKKLETQKDTLNARKKVLKENAGKRKLNNTIALYMTPAISIGDSMNYEQESRKLAAMGDQILDNIKKGTVFSNKAGFTGEDVAVGSAMAAGAGVAALAGGLGKLLPGDLGMLAGGSSGAALGAAVGDEMIRNMGKALNPNEYMQYKTTQLRTFTFNWKMLPNNEQESTACNEIIKVFRSAAHAHRKSPVTLTVPDHVMVSFHGANNMINLPITVLSNVSVTYNPNAASFFKVDGAPVEIDLSITLNELMPIYRDDVENKGY